MEDNIISFSVHFSKCLVSANFLKFIFRKSGDSLCACSGFKICRGICFRAAQTLYMTKKRVMPLDTHLFNLA